MTNNTAVPTVADRPGLSKFRTPVYLGLIGVILTAVIALFAYLGGWLTPNDVTPGRFTDVLEQADGLHPGFRRNHAKGLGVFGFFESNGDGARLSKAAVFRQGQVPVIGRFSLSGGNPHAADMSDTVRGLGIQFTTPDGEVWRTAMVNLPVFPVRTPEAFYERIKAGMPDAKTGKPDPAKMQAFAEKYPESVKALEVIKSEHFSAGFENSTFHSLNAFRFTNSAGTTTHVRWQLEPLQPFEPIGAGSPTRDKNFLFDELIAKVNRHPLQWRLKVIVAQPGDAVNDASIPWPKERESVDVGVLTLDRVESDDTSPSTDITFDPLVLPSGIAPSDDPILSARSAIYSQSFTRRAGESRQPSPVTPAEVKKGE
jgi:catalase